MPRLLRERRASAPSWDRVSRKTRREFPPRAGATSVDCRLRRDPSTIMPRRFISAIARRPSPVTPFSSPSQEPQASRSPGSVPSLPPYRSRRRGRPEARIRSCSSNSPWPDRGRYRPQRTAGLRNPEPAPGPRRRPRALGKSVPARPRPAFPRPEARPGTKALPFRRRTPRATRWKPKAPRRSGSGRASGPSGRLRVDCVTRTRGAPALP